MVARAGRALAVALVILAVAWAAMALWIDGPASRVIAGSLAFGLALVCISAIALIRPRYRGLFAAIVPVVAVALWWMSIASSNNRDWIPDVAHAAQATFDGNRVTIENVRNFKYYSETDYLSRWETRTYDLDQVRGVDMFLCYWGPTLIAHTIASWEFDDGRHLAISIETRKEAGESYSALLGFFRQYVRALYHLRMYGEPVYLLQVINQQSARHGRRCPQAVEIDLLAPVVRAQADHR